MRIAEAFSLQPMSFGVRRGYVPGLLLRGGCDELVKDSDALVGVWDSLLRG